MRTSRRSALSFSLAGVGRAIERWLQIVETALLVALLGAMIGFAAFQIIARNAFGGGLGWADGLVQVALLWVTMVGASAAAGADRHIKIDIVPRFAGRRTRALAARVTALGTAALCATLGWTSIEFIRWDFIDGTTGFGAVPAWMCESIIPLAAGVMAARYLARGVWPARETAPP